MTKVRRLVYSPKAYVYVKDREGNIHDLTNYVTAGNVTRRIDQVSSADITLRNPHMIFTAHVGENGITKPLFSPMDPITIFLQRVRERPVRVFTGFLDRTPYLQLYPGVIQLKASCTLKRLLYTYFDPALPYTQTFLAAYGWLPIGNGTAFSATAYDEFFDKNNPDDLANPKKKEKDGSLANLLYATLKHIGRWKSQDVYVEAMPEDVFTRITALSQEFVRDNKQTEEKFKELLKKLAGASSYGSQDGQGGFTTLPPGTGREIQASVFAPGDAGGQFACAGTKFPGGEIPGGSPPPAGLYYAELSTPAGAGNWNAMGRIFGSSPKDPFGGVAPAQAARITYNGKSVIARKADRGNGGPSQPKIDLWYTTAQALGFSGIGKVKVELLTEDQVKQLENDPAGLGADLPGNLPADSTSTDTTTRSQTKGGSNKDTTGSSSEVFDPIPGATGGVTPQGYFGNDRGDHIHAGIDIPAPHGSPIVAPADGKIGRFSQNSGFAGGGMIHFVFANDMGDIKAGTVIGWGHASSAPLAPGTEVKAGQRIGSTGTSDNGFPHVHFIQRNDGSAMDGSVDPAPLYNAVKDGNTNFTAAPASGGGGGTGGDAATAAVTAAIGATAFGQIEWPSMAEQAESTLLGGEKSLMNDKPVLPFVQQLCNASLRHFQSLPDGRFYAFFPDYFGEFKAHPPYWEIDDIEILDGSVDLNDDALVTHMHVVGDTVNPASGGSPFVYRAMHTSGVITVFNMFMADSVLNRAEQANKNEKEAEKKLTKEEKKILASDPGGMGILLDRKEVVNFLDRYGARPLVEDMPFIRSPYYEMFLAYQKFLLAWSRQFATPFSFTFMPELFPGGKVGFPQHGLQMYIEEVSHGWDYESGFTSTATLSAPSVYAVEGNEAAVNLLPPNMVNAIIDPVKKK